MIKLMGCKYCTSENVTLNTEKSSYLKGFYKCENCGKLLNKEELITLKDDNDD